MEERTIPVHLSVVSDLHLGSSYCQHEAFIRFLDALPTDTALILNGDILDRPHTPLSPAHNGVLDRLRHESYERQIVWVHGNHDAWHILPDPAQITFAEYFSVEDRLLIMHGHTFDDLMPKSRPFMKLFLRWHQLRLWCGAQPRHVADYAKRWPSLYRVLTQHVMRNAVRAAKLEGFSAITCGHTHYPEALSCDGVQYLNTGSWTETPNFYVAMTPHTLELRQAEPLSDVEEEPKGRATSATRQNHKAHKMRAA